MAEWTNLFDLGECTVKVLADDEVLFSDVMAKGGSQQFINPDDDSEHYTIAVSDDGVVSLSNDDGSSYNNHSFDVQVIPSYAHDFPARIRGAVFNENTSAATGAINYDFEDTDSIAYDSLFPASPEPLDMSALTGVRDFVEMYARPSF